MNIDHYLIKFERHGVWHNKPDIFENVGDAGLLLLRTGFGKTVRVSRESNGTTVFQEKGHSLAQRVAAAALAILLLPLTVLGAGIGCMGAVFSESRAAMAQAYSKKPAEIKGETPDQKAELEIGNEEDKQDTSPPPCANPRQPAKKEWKVVDSQEQKQTLATLQWLSLNLPQESNPAPHAQTVIEKYDLRWDKELPSTENIAVSMFVAVLKHLAAADLTKTKNLDTLCSYVPHFAKDEVDVHEVSIDELKDAEEELLNAIGTLAETADVLAAEKELKNLIAAKTIFIKKRDLYKYGKHKGKGIPNPKAEITFSSAEALSAMQLPSPGKKLRLIPKYLYQWDHPMDSEEGIIPIQLMFAPRKPSPMWRKAMDYVQDEVLGTPLWQQNPDKLFELLVALQSKMTGAQQELRKMFTLVADPAKCSVNPLEIRDYLKQKNNGKVLVKRFNRFASKVGYWGSTEKAALFITPKEWQATQEAIFIPPSPEGLEEKVKAFFQKAHAVMQQSDLHPFQVAAFLHHGIAILHPFNDYNGRLARTYANIYLMQKGYQPFFVTNDKAYTKLFYAENYDQAFCQYLSDTLAVIEKMDFQESTEEQQEPECFIM